SRRRHTRSKRDWSSDVCSSDLGIITGAAIGGLVTLFNQETRKYVKDTAEEAYNQTNHFLQNPEDGVNKVRQGIVSVNRFVADNTDGAMNALSQAENTLQKFLK